MCGAMEAPHTKVEYRLAHGLIYLIAEHVIERQWINCEEWVICGYRYIKLLFSHLSLVIVPILLAEQAELLAQQERERRADLIRQIRAFETARTHREVLALLMRKEG